MVYAIVLILILIIDQGLKYWTVTNIALNSGEVPLIEGVVQLVYVRNYGVAFGFLKDFDYTRWILVGVTAIFAIVVIYVLSAKIIKSPLGRWSAVLVLAGALGNGIDRLFIGYVVDMIEVLFIDFYVFNFADICVVVFGILFCFYILFNKDDQDEPLREKAPKLSRAERRAMEEEYIEPAIDETRRGGDIEMVRRATVRTAVKTEPVRQVVEEPAKYDPQNPFSEWDKSPTAPKQEEYIKEYTPRVEKVATPTYEPVAQPIATPKAEPKPKASSDDFDLDDILAEFKD